MDARVEAFKKLSAAAVSDALDRLGLHGACLGIASLAVGNRMVGRAFTIKYIPVGSVKGTVGDYIDDVTPGDVIVLDNSGRLDCTVWGDILTAIAHKRGIAGTVIHGVCRDVARSFELRYPIFSRGRFMRTGKDRVQVEGTNVPVSLGDVQVRPGDILIGSDDGVVVVPQDREEEVLALAQSISQAEDRILSEALGGMRLDEVRKKYGYHELQRRAAK
ncbi:MAG: diguanylate cyclase [Deltaproteobacteria bacterium RIFCSPLOWO2_12_FULL_60_19]|nr:MAG: diguanylate cyclase [Deltaproteobacteria bacterium RIFCSPLOWO2_12_FULL_60_19]